MVSFDHPKGGSSKVVQQAPAFDLAVLSEVILDGNDGLVIGLDLGLASGPADQGERILVGGDPIERGLEKLLGQPGIRLMGSLGITIEHLSGGVGQKALGCLQHVRTTL